MRDILFRGKIKDTKVWTYGYLNQHRGEPIYDVYGNLIDGYYIRDWAEKTDTGLYGCNYCIEPETIGQYTGLIDMNGTEIFEGDVLADRFEERYIAKWTNEGIPNCIFAQILRGGATEFMRVSSVEFISEHLRIIGNIHENPELWKED